MSQSYFYEVERGHGLAHDPFKAIVAPRPIGWISTRGTNGVVNLAPYSFFNALSGEPPIVAFCSTGWKDSITNIAATREFVANMAVRPLCAAVNLTSGDFPPEVDEMAIAGLTAAPCRLVGAPRVAESPAALECRLLQTQQLADLEGRQLDAYLVIGQVVGVHIDPGFIRDGMFDTAAAAPILRAGYRGDYFGLGEKFEMVRPSAASLGNFLK